MLTNNGTVVMTLRTKESFMARVLEKITMNYLVEYLKFHNDKRISIIC